MKKAGKHIYEEENFESPVPDTAVAPQKLENVNAIENDKKSVDNEDDNHYSEEFLDSDVEKNKKSWANFT